MSLKQSRESVKMDKNHKSFTKIQAISYVVNLAKKTPVKARFEKFNGKTFFLKHFQIVTSTSVLSNIYGWNTIKVLRLINDMPDLTGIKYRKTNKGTVLTVPLTLDIQDV